MAPHRLSPALLLSRQDQNARGRRGSGGSSIQEEEEEEEARACGCEGSRCELAKALRRSVAAARMSIDGLSRLSLLDGEGKGGGHFGGGRRVRRSSCLSISEGATMGDDTGKLALERVRPLLRSVMGSWVRAQHLLRRLSLTGAVVQSRNFGGMRREGRLGGGWEMAECGVAAGGEGGGLSGGVRLGCGWGGWWG